MANNEYTTPSKILDFVKDVFGGKIDLDPASNVHSNRIVQAEAIYTKKANGLDLPWYGKVFCNPPYSYPLVEQFAEKICSEYNRKNVSEAFFLVNSSTSSAWYQNVLKEANALIFVAGRVNFITTENIAKYNDFTVGKSSQWPTSLFYFGSQLEKVKEKCTIGFVVTL